MQGMPGALQVLAALLHGVQTIHTYDSNKEPDIVGSLDLTVTQVCATTFFQQALLPHPMWLGPLPVCLVEHHHGKVRRLRLVLATITHLTKAEINSLVEGPCLPGGTVLHDLVYGYAANHLPQHPGNHSAAFLNVSNRGPRWMISKVVPKTGQELH